MMSGNSVLLSRFQRVSLGESLAWPRGVTVSTLDSESSDRGSNPREAFLFENVQYFGGCDLHISNTNLLFFRTIVLIDLQEPTNSRKNINVIML